LLINWAFYNFLFFSYSAISQVSQTNLWLFFAGNTLLLLNTDYFIKLGKILSPEEIKEHILHLVKIFPYAGKYLFLCRSPNKN